MGIYKQTTADKAVEKALAFPFIFVGCTIYYFIKGILILIFERNKYKISVITFTIVLFILDLLLIYPKDLVKNIFVHLIICFSPIICTSVFGYMSKANNNFDAEFKEIGFYTRGENVPKLIYKADKMNLIDQKYRIYVFKTLIPITKWNQQRESIENIIADPKKNYTYSINHIEKSGSKKVKIYTTFDFKNSYDENPSVKIDWNNNLLNKGLDSIIVLGIDKLYLNIVKIDIDDKNILLAGEPGSGKSVELKLIVWQLYKHGWDLDLSDFKSGAEFNEDFEKIAKVITDRKAFLNKTVELFEESERRMNLFKTIKKNNIKDYNKSVPKEKRIRRRALVVDELACILDNTGMDKDDLKIILKIEFYLSELARKCRAAGIHLILCMQRPDSDILKGQIKNMLGIRISGRFADGVASKIVLDNTMANQLPAIQGRMILKVGADLKEFQGYYFDMENYSEQISNKKNIYDNSNLIALQNARNNKSSNTNKKSYIEDKKDPLDFNLGKRPYLSHKEFIQRKIKNNIDKA
ncbi:MAG: FtsK/SpoIIIE domain-containing protein [Clostridiales bacterium]